MRNWFDSGSDTVIPISARLRAAARRGLRQDLLVLGGRNSGLPGPSRRGVGPPGVLQRQRIAPAASGPDTLGSSPVCTKRRAISASFMFSA